MDNSNPEIHVFFPDEEIEPREFLLECECGGRSFLITQNTFNLRDSMQITGIQCTKCGMMMMFNGAVIPHDGDKH